jgi:hypothetical protein
MPLLDSRREIGAALWCSPDVRRNLHELASPHLRRTNWSGSRRGGCLGAEPHEEGTAMVGMEEQDEVALV